MSTTSNRVEVVQANLDLRGAVHTHVMTQSVKLTLCFWTTHPSMITSSVVMNVYLKWVEVFPWLFTFMNKKAILTLLLYSQYYFHYIYVKCFLSCGRRIIFYLKNFISLKFGRFLEFGYTFEAQSLNSRKHEFRLSIIRTLTRNGKK